MALTIPQIRDRLHELANEHAIPELAVLADATRRRYRGRRAPAKAQGITPELEQRVRLYADQHPQEPLREVGRRHGIDQGRVSEILTGKREDK